ncbi:cache domain-containing protein [Methylomonas sp. SURF-2]|uniref:Cache domain-containing protein n=1 Tax=Methylomonas subterranea TaxID=2952225 RepID=A0ABT1TBP0_9GAMM|nr:cache domain-containing protein [Methylomonas sp. SURF-2]MCQ8102881.1 cache domain-containing protein [Methylomonas sp. SURF-2]
MPDVKSFENRLAQLNGWWGKITLIGKINSHNVAATILDDMNRTQNKFGELQQQLTQNLLYENVQKLVLDNSSKAQVAIDLLIRNLFERTADVGFLATDNDIREFLAEPQPSRRQTDFIENRLREYVKKYSVYDEIMVFDTQGRLMAHLDENNLVSCSDDPLLSETLASQEDYLETFRHSDLQPNRRHSLIYSRKITETDQKTSKPLGVLCLCFRFDDEIQGIFANLLSREDVGVMTILAVDGQVIASSNEQLVPLRAKFNVDTPLRINTYQGRDYITNTRQTSGYQGFFGLGWYGQMMTPLDRAFHGKPSANRHGDFAGIMEQASSFPAELRNIRKASADINADLGLLVLNGQIASARKNAAEFMPVLEAIKEIGSDIASIFTASVNRLQEVTVMSSHLNNAGFLAALAVDIMDRNLYERANDCRWWALTSAFRQKLAAELSAGDKRQISEILQYINALYTVYTNLYVYNAEGEILAVSDSKQSHWVGNTVDAASGALAALQNPDSQKYSVSPFAVSHLYQNRHTYIYNAAITDLAEPSRVLGGIGIVFDSEPQFSAMLEETLPRDENGRLLNHCFAVYADRNQNIIAVANRPDLKAGDKLDLDEKLFGLSNGRHSSDIVQYNDRNYVLGMAASKGYREYKTRDGYQNDVLALVFIPF